jgi:hypothetical protein
MPSIKIEINSYQELEDLKADLENRLSDLEWEVVA